MGRRGAGRRLNDQERMEIIDIITRESKVKNVDLAKRYGVSEGAIRKLKQIKDTIRDRYYLGNEHNRDRRKRGGFARNAQFEQELYEWICRMRESQAYQIIPLTQTAVRQQAILLAKNYESMSSFKASPGWFARFCSRHRLDPPMAAVPSAADNTVAAAAAASVNGIQLGMKPMNTVDNTAALTVTFQSMEPLQSVSATSATLPVQDVPADTKAAVALDLSCSEALNQETQLAARQHNAAALKESETHLVKTEAAVASTQTTAEMKREPSTVDTKEQPAKAVGAQTPTEDEIFSLGL